MKKENLIVMSVIGGLILLALGFCLGLGYAQKGIEKTEIESPLVNLVDSKVINGLNTLANGDVAEISGRNLTLTKDGDSLTISIKEDAIINRLLPPETGNFPPDGGEIPVVIEKMGFEEIKVGDRVNISCQLKADGSLEGLDLTVSQ